MQMKALVEKQTTQEETIQAAKALVDQLFEGQIFVILKAWLPNINSTGFVSLFLLWAGPKIELTDETQSIGDLVAQECKSMTATQKQGCLETVELKTLLLILDKKRLNGTKCE